MSEVQSEVKIPVLAVPRKVIKSYIGRTTADIEKFVARECLGPKDIVSIVSYQTNYLAVFYWTQGVAAKRR